MVLTDKDIRQLVQEKKLIDGFKEERLQAASYDVSSSSKIERFKKLSGRITLISKDSVDSVCEEEDINFGYDLNPGEYILIRTEEKFKLPNNLIAHIRPRTTLIKLGLVVSSQHINPTFNGFLYLGLHNISPNIIEILPGLVIGQMVFEELRTIPTKEKLYENKINAKYQNEENFIGSQVYNDFEEKFKNTYKKLMDDLLGKRG